jgi:hypothetical protein
MNCWKGSLIQGEKTLKNISGKKKYSLEMEVLNFITSG